MLVTSHTVVWLGILFAAYLSVCLGTDISATVQPIVVKEVYEVISHRDSISGGSIV